jgi:hypothetical protein
MTVRKIEYAEATSLRPKTKNQLEVALSWPEGYVDQVLKGTADPNPPVVARNLPTENMFIKGRWYGPSYPDAGDPPAGWNEGWAGIEDVGPSPVPDAVRVANQDGRWVPVGDFTASARWDNELGAFVEFTNVSTLVEVAPLPMTVEGLIKKLVHDTGRLTDEEGQLLKAAMNYHGTNLASRIQPSDADPAD